MREGLKLIRIEIAGLHALILDAIEVLLAFLPAFNPGINVLSSQRCCLIRIEAIKTDATLMAIFAPSQYRSEE